MKDPVFMESLSCLTSLRYASAGSVAPSLARSREALKVIALAGRANADGMKARTLETLEVTSTKSSVRTSLVLMPVMYLTIVGTKISWKALELMTELLRPKMVTRAYRVS